MNSQQNLNSPFILTGDQQLDFQQMFSSLSVMFYVEAFNPDHELEYLSPAFESLGYSLKEIYEDPKILDRVMHPDDFLMMKEANKPVYELEQIETNYEYRIFRKNGEMRWWKDCGRPIFNENGDRIKWFGIISDITDRKYAEENLKKSKLDLEHSNRELQDFAYVASHDLQEPLRKVQAFGDRLEKKFSEALSDEGRDYIKRMRSAAGRMQILINDLLTFSRVSTNTKPFQAVDIKKIATDVISDLEVRIEETKGRIEIGELPVIDADPLQMRQLFQNILGNALKFHRAGEPPVIEVSAQFSNANPGNVKIQNNAFITQNPCESTCQIIIKDNGIGFEQKYLDRIFTVFQRLHNRANYEGSGIGLSVCRKIVERHGGEITALSEPDKGATFLVTLPVKQNQNAA